MSKKRVFIIHGWEGYPEEGWFPWLKNELEQTDFEVFVPAMPNTDEPEINAWVSHLSEVVGEPTENDFFVGHSIGCQTILRYLEKLDNKKVGGVVFVAGWFNLNILEGPEEEKIAKLWVETPINFETVKKATNKFTVIFSDNDPYVPLEANKKIFEEKLGAKIITEHQKGHFSGSDGIKELSVVLNNILKVSKKGLEH